MHIVHLSINLYQRHAKIEYIYEYITMGNPELINSTKVSILTKESTSSGFTYVTKEYSVIPIDSEESVIAEMKKTVAFATPDRFLIAIDKLDKNGTLDNAKKRSDEYNDHPHKLLMDVYDCIVVNRQCFRVIAILMYNINLNIITWEKQSDLQKCLYVKIICTYCGVEDTLFPPINELIENHYNILSTVYKMSKSAFSS